MLPAVYTEAIAKIDGNGAASNPTQTALGVITVLTVVIPLVLY